MRKVEMNGAVHWAEGDTIPTIRTLCGLRPRHWNAYSAEDDAEVTCVTCADAVSASPAAAAGEEGEG